MQTNQALKDFYDSVRWSIPCCPNCENFRVVKQMVMNEDGKLEDAPAKEFCDLDPAQRRPPAKIIAFGCPKFVQDIPF